MRILEALGKISAFGLGWQDSDPDGDGVGHWVTPRIPGQYNDYESGLYYNWYRYYDLGTLAAIGDGEQHFGSKQERVLCVLKYNPRNRETIE